MAKGNKLTPELQLAVIQRLAAFDTPKMIADDLKKEGIEISPQGIETYDPNKVAGAKLSEKLKAVFEKARRAFLEDTSTIPIANKAVRLRTLQRMADKAEGSGNMVLASTLLEQAAKEVGNAFTNKRELSGPGGGPIRTTTSASELTDDELAAIARGRSAGTAGET